MTSERDPDDVLHHTALDPGAVDLLLTGSLGPEDVPAEYAAAASLLRAVGGPASADELVDRAGSVEALLAGARGEAQPTAASIDEVGARRRRIPAKVTAIAAATAVGLTGVAAAAGITTGVFGGQDHPATTQLPSASSSSVPGSRDGSYGRTTGSTLPSRSIGGLTEAVRSGLCNAPGVRDATEPRSAAAAALGNAAAAAGQAVDEFCTMPPPSTATPSSTLPAADPTSASGAATAPNSSNAGGNGNSNSNPGANNNAGGNGNSISNPGASPPTQPPAAGGNGNANGNAAVPTLPPAAGGNGRGAGPQR